MFALTEGACDLSALDLSRMGRGLARAHAQCAELTGHIGTIFTLMDFVYHGQATAETWEPRGSRILLVCEDPSLVENTRGPQDHRLKRQ
eukprot:1850425-Pyramimonas_sp.AAC.1